MADEIVEILATAELLATLQSRMLKAAKDKRTSGWLKTNLESFEILWKEFHKRHLPISRNSDLQEHEYLRTSSYDTAHNHYIDVKTLILYALSPGRNQSTVEVDQDYTGVMFDAPYKTKLPTLDLPKFSGKQVEWEAYKEMFIALIHNVSTIPPVFKLQYLISSLTGDAAKRLKNTQIKAANYNGAWETMLKRYDNNRVNLFAHMKSIVSCPPVSRKSETEISRVLDIMLEAKRGFANLEFPVKHWDAWLVFHTLQKLDGATREKVKIRVVFNASQASTNGRSLNDELLTGPKLQEDLWIVLTRWRFFRFVFTTDVVKMFRQILVSREDTNLQLIVWRETLKDELRTYRLLTVTYGTAAAPFLANRVPLELAQQYKSQYPLGANIREHHKYVDDFLAFWCVMG